MRSHRLRVATAFTIVVPSLAAALAGCSSQAGGGHEDAVGSASVALTQVPTTVQCVEIDTVGETNASQRFGVRGGQGSVLTLGGLPVGNVDFTAEAFDAACSDVGAAPSWISQSVSATLSPGVTANVTLELVPSTSATVGVDFNSSSFRDVTTFAGQAQQLGNVDGTGSAARFTRPQQLAFGNGKLYVADARQNVIRSIDVATANVVTIAGTAGAAAGSADGNGAAARFNVPIGVAFDAGTNAVYVTDTANCTVRKIDLATSAVSTVAGSAGSCVAADGTGNAATFAGPYGLAPDGAGHLYVSDPGAATIRQIDLASGAVTTVAGATGQTGTVDGPVATARFQGPAGIAYDGANLWILDGTAVRIFFPQSGQVFTAAGDASTSGSADGATARFAGPEGIAFDGNQTIYVTDFFNSDVRAIDANTGFVTTVAGSVGVLGAADGHGAAAQFRHPIGVAVDDGGNVFVADAANATIRKM